MSNGHTHERFYKRYCHDTLLLYIHTTSQVMRAYVTLQYSVLSMHLHIFLQISGNLSRGHHMHEVMSLSITIPSLPHKISSSLGASPRHEVTYCIGHGLWSLSLWTRSCKPDSCDANWVRTTLRPIRKLGTRTCNASTPTFLLF